jgi:hypothetical protein
VRFTRFAKGFQRGKKVGKNKLEQEYEGILALRVRMQEIQEFAYEAITLKIADDTRYTPDFFVVANDDVMECHEVKAGMLKKIEKDGVLVRTEVVPMSEDASRVKIRVAAEKFPFRFVLAYKYKGEWHRKEI